MRNEPMTNLGSTPIANKTCEGSIAPLAQALAADAQIIASSNRNKIDSLSQPEIHKCAIPGTRLSRATVSRTSSSSLSTASTRASRNFVTREISASRVESVSRNAAAVAMMPPTLCVPLRRSRSWPPPTISGSISRPIRCIVTPMPFGPPNLCADTVNTSTSFEISRKSCQHVACTASVCNIAPGAFARTTFAT